MASKGLWIEAAEHRCLLEVAELSAFGAIVGRREHPAHGQSQLLRQDCAQECVLDEVVVVADVLILHRRQPCSFATGVAANSSPSPVGV
jgi:hypothetical protein